MRKLSLMVLLLFTIWLFADNSPLILIHGLNGRPSDMSSLEEAVSNTFQFSDRFKVGYDSNAKIEDIAISVGEQIANSAQVNNKQAVVIAHSMGGLVARQYMLNKQASSAVKALITIGTPHTGTGLATIPNWIAFLGTDIAAIVAPPVLDIQPERSIVLATTAGSILIFAEGIGKLAAIGYILPLIPAQWNLSLSVQLDAFSNRLAAYKNSCISEMALNNQFLSNLNSATLPVKGSEGKSIYYASIYGTKSDLFPMLEELTGYGTEVQSALGTISINYATWGAYYVATNGWWNWVRLANGLAYLAGAAITFPPHQSWTYNTLLVGSSESDAVVPTYSQKFPKNVVPISSGATYIDPVPADDANHLEETIPTQKVKYALDYILERAQVPKIGSN